MPRCKGQSKKNTKKTPTASNIVSSYAKVEQDNLKLKEKLEVETDTPIPASEYTDFYTEYEQDDTSDTESLQSFSSSLQCGAEQDLEIDEEYSNQYSFISKLEPVNKKKCCENQLQFDEYEDE